MRKSVPIRPPSRFAKCFQESHPEAALIVFICPSRNNRLAPSQARNPSAWRPRPLPRGRSATHLKGTGHGIDSPGSGRYPLTGTGGLPYPVHARAPPVRAATAR